MPISQSSVFPSSLKSLTLAAGGTIALAPGVIMSIFAQGSGSKVTYVQMDKSVTFATVTETPAQVAAGTTLFLIPIVVFTVLLRKHLLRGITFGAVRK